VLTEPTAVRTYRSRETSATPANVMIDALSGSPWLRSITSDHAWRVDARAVNFFDFPHVRGGTGQFPVWESCLLRPTFRTLFSDWENPMAAFPELGDVPSPDPDSDPLAPAITLAIEGRSHDDGSTFYLDRENLLTLVASDGAGFTDEHVALRYRVRAEGAEPGAFVETGPETSFSLEGPDGVYLVEYQSQDPCHTFADESAGAADDPLPPGALQSFRVTLAMIGTDGNDRLIGSNRDDIVLGLGGNDRLLGRGGNDELRGGPGHDKIDGGADDDALFGEEGNDRILGGAGDDWIYGGPGDDALRGESGFDVILGEDGRDLLRGGAHADHLVGGPGQDRLKADKGFDLCAVGLENDKLRSCEHAY
jgi:hypothetical protein